MLPILTVRVICGAVLKTGYFISTVSETAFTGSPGEIGPSGNLTETHITCTRMGILPSEE